jgi:hypothetical protein
MVTGTAIVRADVLGERASSRQARSAPTSEVADSMTNAQSED